MRSSWWTTAAPTGPATCWRAGSGQPDLKILLHERNQGKGAALKTGFQHVAGDAVIIQDADLEYDPAEYRYLLQPIIQDGADVVFGSRFAGDNQRVLYFWHYLGNRLLTTLSNCFTNLNLTDMETCYKVFTREMIERIAPTLAGEAVRHRTGDHGQGGGPARRADLRTADQLLGPDLRRGQEDHLAGRPAGVVVHHPRTGGESRETTAAALPSRSPLSSSASAGGSARVDRAEPVDGPAQAFAERDVGLPAEMLSGQADVGLAAGRVVRPAAAETELRVRAGQFEHQFGQFADCELVGVAEVHRADEVPGPVPSCG